MRRRVALSLALIVGAAPAVAAADSPVLVAPSASACPSPGTLECPTYERYVNHKYGFSVDVPTFFVKKTGDADGRGQPFEFGSRARIRAWAMYDNPPMTLRQLYEDWTRRDGITFKTIAGNTWVVRGKAEGGRLFYSRSILSEGLITTVDVTYDRDLGDALEPILAHLGATLMTLPGEGLRLPKGKI
jgi:hypothetical protein